VTVRVRESDRARMTRILIGPERPLEIIVPAGTSDASIHRALNGKKEWIAKKRREFQARKARPPASINAAPGYIRLAGDEYPLITNQSQRPVALLRAKESSTSAVPHRSNAPTHSTAGTGAKLDNASSLQPHATPNASVLSTARWPYVTRGHDGAPARPPVASRSPGASSSRRRKSSSTSSSTNSATSACRITRRPSGGPSTTRCPSGATPPHGSNGMPPRCTPTRRPYPTPNEDDIGVKAYFNALVRSRQRHAFRGTIRLHEASCNGEQLRSLLHTFRFAVKTALRHTNRHTRASVPLRAGSLRRRSRPCRRPSSLRRALTPTQRRCRWRYRGR
jgi:Protein of unknown function DUF45